MRRERRSLQITDAVREESQFAFGTEQGVEQLNRAGSGIT